VLGRVTVNIGTLSGGVSPNLVPASAHAAADIRLPVGITIDAVERRLAALLAGIPGVELRVLRRFEPNFTDPGQEIVRRVVDNAAAVLGERPALNMRVGASEWISIDELHAVAQVHALTAYDFLRGDAP
jgi:succinyl-diaminopimelate desuccinylase